jgi:flagellar hook protein FlgE
MSYALSSGVTGLQAHQKMLDVAGNNLANVNTTAYKSSRINFSELLGQTLQQASQPTDRIGGTNPQQMGSGVGVSSIAPDMSQGSIVNTGNPLDVAIEGEGYFVLSDGERFLYTRSGTFGVDQNSNLVDPSTGYKVQRLGLTGESDGFQVAGDSSVRVPYDVALPANPTSEVTISGNLSSDATSTGQYQTLSSSLRFTINNGIDAAETTKIGELDQFTDGSGTGGKMGATQTGTITFSGFNPDGTTLTGSFSVTASSTMTNLIDHLNNNILDGATASLVNGHLCVTDDATGYSRSDISMSYTGDGELETPPYFELSAIGGEEVKSVNIAVYDSQGGKHVLSAAFVRTDDVNTWDMVLTSVTGNVTSINPVNRRITDISFDPESGAYAGIPEGQSAQFVMTFAQDTSNPQTIALDFGTVGSFDGLTQFAGNSTAVAREQDGYGAGSLSAVSVSNEGVLIGAFSNGIKKDIAVLEIALFKNAAGLQSNGGGYYTPSANSGGAVATQAMSTGAGTIHGGALEKSNADVATEFVNLIQAQNGFQANARTIRVANEILQELTNLIR